MTEPKASETRGSLAWPDHDTGPVPPPQYRRRERDEDRLTRKPLAFWDRVKFLVLLAGAFGVFVWAAMSDNALLPFGDAFNQQLRAKRWIVVLFVIEVLRQVHYLASERSARYHQFWSVRVFGGIDRRAASVDDWNRYRAGRVLRLVFALVLVDVVLASSFHTSPASALFELPRRLWHALPFVFQLLFGVVFIILEFGALFWFLSRGGTDVYFPDDIKTRFSDVWGQDAVLEKVKENIVFLEAPETIEEKGGYIPAGILLWGPPGTGKTLMAEAVAGETGKPYVFVDPGAFINMFMGIGVIKVKSLFRKLRKLAVRYGGVIVFFDEADSLGSRSMLGQGVFGGGASASP